MDTATDGPFADVLAEILQAEEQGQAPDLERLVADFPDLESRLRAYFRNREGFDRLAPHLAPAAYRPGASPAPPDLAPGSQFAGYEVVRELGRGGMGIVFLARQRSANRLVALKLIRADRLAHLTPPQRQEWLTRFRTEGQAAARIGDDRVVTVYEVGAHDGRPFYSMRYVEGRSLAESLKAGPLANRPAALLMEQVARAVQAVHEQGVLHRDLKPHNILVDARGRPYLTDFGLAKWLVAGESLTHTGDLLGSPHYMSPEQAEDSAKVSEATDVYGLGATLYALLTGRPPFQGTTVTETLHQVKYREPEPPRRVNPAVDRDLNTIALKCLEKEPGRRFRGAAAMANELQRYLEGRPILSRPIGPPGRLWRWRRRNPAFAALCAAAVVLVTLAGALSWAYWLASGAAGVAGQQVNKITKDLQDQQAQDEEDAYFSDMRRAQAHLNAGEVAITRDLLAKWQPKDGKKTDHRAWEWYFLDAQCREQPFSVRGHSGQVQAAAWSPDGERLASADRQGVVRVWSLADGKDRPLFETPPTTGGVGALAWSLDGKHLAAACQGKVRLWDARTYQEKPALQTAGNSLSTALSQTGADITARQILLDTWIASLTWSPDSRKLALFDANGNVQVWDLPTGKGDGLLLGTDKGGVHSAAWSPDSKRLASVGGDGVVTVWNPPEYKRQDLTPPVSARDIVTHAMPSYALTWADDEHVELITGDGNIRTLDAKSGAPFLPGRELLPRQGPAVWPGRKELPLCRYVWGPNGKLLAGVRPRAPLLAGDLRIWDAGRGREVFLFSSVFDVRQPAVVGPAFATGCAPAWDRNGGRLALGDDQGMVKVWDLGTGRQTVRTPVVCRYVSGLSWSFDSKNILCAADVSEDDILAVNKQQAQQGEAWMKAHPGPGIGPPPPDFMALPLPAGQNLPESRIPGARPQVELRDAVTGEPVRVIRKLASGVKPTALAQSPNGKWLALAVGAGVELQPADGGGQAVSLSAPAGSLLCWNGDSKRLATAHQNTILLWDRDHSREPVRGLEGKPVGSLAWSPDGKRLASAGDGTVTVWDVTSGKPISTFPYFVMHEPIRFSVGGKIFAFSILSWCDGGKRLAVAGEDETIRIWDVDTRKELTTLRGHESNEAHENHNVVCSVACSPDGKRLVSASPDGTFLVWDTATWKEVLALRPVIMGPAAKEICPYNAGPLAWSPDGWQLGFFGAGGAVTIWDATPEEDKPGQQKAAEGSAAASQEDKPGQEKAAEDTAVAALEKVGAGIRRDEKRPGKPVLWVDLTNKTQVTDADLKGLKDLKSLQMLNLGVTRVTDACLKDLKDLKSLRTLNLPLTQVTDEGLNDLKDLQGLQILNLGGTRVTDAGLKNLKGLKSLQLLDLTNTRATDAGLKDIKEALPQCRVIK